MSHYNNASELNTLTLGKATSYSSTYDNSLLQAVPRSLNRSELNLSNDNLPFNGADVWYGYELSWLNAKGKPIVVVAEFTFPADSPNIVESKSFKLYLNSFNQTKFSSTEEVTQRLTQDLSSTCGAQATVTLFPVTDCPALMINHPEAECIDDIDIEISSYELQPELLQLSNNKAVVTESLSSHLLKSNCLITNQPDWASIYINYSGQAIDKSSLLKYLISFRQHNEFHEQCVERIFCDIQQQCQPESLTVFARYTRRGGLDINPYRSSTTNKPPHARTLRQ
ncbi:NADPH-dependent 7-cyano-7-deazaguanine reductase QueF [Thalassotalea sp. G2M2-11]|uniref:NADPH-dependent 7-cyano-7-deazaguanine reductase QueF n=1 Tax=Thalassotalea sp. G2M2-11 TaxID=2787627 RepID=UPI0019D1E364|nr:NADPH-dependent 7-cyano-7-deazaguanine reductase QueF [Thalassotalea sp. G2M2-11]